MCGIVGYIGKAVPIKKIVSTLEKLEYRGYDSSGVASHEKGNIKNIKSVGNISKLKQKIDIDENTTLAIAHTRWATHGLVTEENAHPHVSSNGNIVLVHNGIIENYEELKKKYNLNPIGESDTAVLADLIGKINPQNIFEFIDIFYEVKGSFAICMFSKTKDVLFLAKRNSPLFVSENHNDFLVGSDLVCFDSFSNKYYDFEDNEFAIIEKEKIKFYNNRHEPVKKEEKTHEMKFENVSKNGYEHFMLKEIMEEKEVLLSQVDYYKKNNILDCFEKEFFDGIKKVKLIGCGTAYHAGIIGKYYCEKILGIPACAEIASEFVYGNPKFISQDELYIFVSQSGETADILKSLEIIKKHNAKFISLTNVLHSSLARKSKYILPVCAGMEIAVASTKAYVCQLTALYMFFKIVKNPGNKEIVFGDIKTLANQILNFNKDKIDEIADGLKDKKEAIFIGKEMDFVTASEASLKLKEISYINSSSFPSGELKHGYLALVEKDTPLFVFENELMLKLKTDNAAEEAVCRGAKKIVISAYENEKENKNTIKITAPNELLLPVSAIVPMQYMAYKTSLLKNLCPDQPRNLAKSVTVE